MHCTRSPQARQATKLENPRRLSSTMVCSPFSRRWPSASMSLRENVFCLRVSRNSWRISISSTAGMGRASMRPGQFEQRVLAALRVVAALQAGRGGAQHHARAGRLRAHDGDVAPVVARRFFLFVAAVVLFVHHDQAQVAHRREDAGARAHHHRRRARNECAAIVRSARHR